MLTFMIIYYEVDRQSPYDYKQKFLMLFLEIIFHFMLSCFT